MNSILQWFAMMTVGLTVFFVSLYTGAWIAKKYKPDWEIGFLILFGFLGIWLFAPIVMIQLGIVDGHN